MKTLQSKLKSIVSQLQILVLSLVLASCASNSTISAPAECPLSPPKPALSQPLPSVSYSEVAQSELKALRIDMDGWRKLLTGMPQTLRR